MDHDRAAMQHADHQEEQGDPRRGHAMSTIIVAINAQTLRQTKLGGAAA